MPASPRHRLLHPVGHTQHGRPLPLDERHRPGHHDHERLHDLGHLTYQLLEPAERPPGEAPEPPDPTGEALDVMDEAVSVMDLVISVDWCR